MDFIESEEELMANAFLFADAIHEGGSARDEALNLVAAGRVYLPFRYGDQLAFAPAKFIGYKSNDFETYRTSVYNRHGGRARSAVSRVLKRDAAENSAMEKLLENYCLKLGIEPHQHRHSFWITKSTQGYQKRDRSAINDIDAGDIGNGDPEYQRRMRGSYARDQRVRRAVLERAAGYCELCGEQGFTSRSGHPFLETHHIIKLSEEGADKLSNVIALCPNDHRRAHFGEDWQQLQDQFLMIIKNVSA